MEMNWVGEGVRGGLSKEIHRAAVAGWVLCVNCVLTTGSFHPIRRRPHSRTWCRHSGLQLGACLWTTPKHTHTHFLLRLCSRSTDRGQSTHDTNLGRGYLLLTGNGARALDLLWPLPPQEEGQFS